MAERQFSSGGIIMRWADDAPEVLLIKDSYGRWTWPKGKIDKGESSEEAAIREIGEEVGLKNVELIEQVGKTEYFFRLKGKLIFKTVYLYLFEHKGNEGLKVLHKEIQDASWFTTGEALEKIEYKGSKGLLKKAIKRFLKTSDSDTAFSLKRKDEKRH